MSWLELISAELWDSANVADGAGGAAGRDAAMVGRGEAKKGTPRRRDPL
jgi:hypothetical protein